MDLGLRGIEDVASLKMSTPDVHRIGFSPEVSLLIIDNILFLGQNLISLITFLSFLGDEA